MGDVHDIAEKIINDTPLTKLVKENIKGHKLNTAAVILIILGSPIWGSLLVSILSVFAAVYASLWSVVISLWAVFAALALSGPAALVIAVFLFGVKPLKAMFMIGAAIAGTATALMISSSAGSVGYESKIIEEKVSKIIVNAAVSDVRFISGSSDIIYVSMGDIDIRFCEMS